MPRKSPKSPCVESPDAPLTEHYYGYDAGPDWHLYCRKCDRGWRLSKEKADNPGNLLHLLNHARSH